MIVKWLGLGVWEIIKAHLNSHWRTFVSAMLRGGFVNISDIKKENT